MENGIPSVSCSALKTDKTKRLINKQVGAFMTFIVLTVTLLLLVAALSGD